MDDLRFAVFRRLSGGEVPFNYQFGGILGYSLETGPDLVSTVHPQVEMGRDTELIALQSESDLDGEIDGRITEIDIVFEDSETILGIESKRSDELTTSQLKRELAVLEQNGGAEDVILLALTEDYVKPAEVEQVAERTEHAIFWRPWHRIARDIEQREFDNGYGAPRKMLLDLFSDTDHIMQFGGFPEPELDPDVYREWLQEFTNIMFDIDRVLHEGPLHLNRGNGKNVQSYSHSYTSKLEKSHIQPAPVSLFVPYTRSPSATVHPKGHDSNLCLYGNYHRDELGVFLNLNAKEDGWSRAVLERNADEIASTAVDNDLFFRVSNNSHESLDARIRDINAVEEMRSFLEDQAGEQGSKRVLIGRLVSKGSTPNQTVETFAEQIEQLYDLFFDDGEMLGKFR